MANQFNILDSSSSVSKASRMPPAAYYAEAYPRRTSGGASQALLTTQIQAFTAIWLEVGQVVTSIAFAAGGTAATLPTNQWFSLYDSSRNKLAVTADDTTTAWSASTIKALILSSPYTITTTGLYYLGIMVKATAVPSIVGLSLNAALNAAPKIAGADATNNTLTDPASAPVTAAAFTDTAIMWAAVA